MLKKLTIVLGMAVAVAGTTTVSSFVFVPEAHAGWYNKAKKGLKKIGRGAKSGAKAVGRTAKKGGRKVWNNGGKAVVRGAVIGIAKVGEYEVRGARAGWRGAKRAGKAIGREARKTGWSAKQGGKDAVGAAKRGAKRVGKGAWKAAKCVTIWVCKGKLSPAPRPAGTKGNPRPAVRDHRS